MRQTRVEGNFCLMVAGAGQGWERGEMCSRLMRILPMATTETRLKGEHRDSAWHIMLVGWLQATWRKPWWRVYRNGDGCVQESVSESR
jgi:hypothetical protein